jgi:hypothetical protein
MTHGQLNFDKFLTFGHFVAFSNDTCYKCGSLKVLLMQRFQTAASVLTHRLPVSENLKVLLMEVIIVTNARIQKKVAVYR